MGVMDFIRGRQRKQQQEQLSAWERYRALLEQFVDGQEVDFDDAEQIMQDAGRTEADLARDCETLEQRRLWRSQIDQEVAANERHAAAKEALESYQEQISNLRRKLQPKIDQALADLRAAEARIGSHNVAINKLRRTIMDPVLVEREKAIEEEAKELGERQRELDGRIVQLQVPALKQAIDNWQRDFDSAHSEDRPAKHLAAEKVQNFRAALKDAQQKESTLSAELDQIESRLRDIAAERAELDRQKLEP